MSEDFKRNPKQKAGEILGDPFVFMGLTAIMGISITFGTAPLFDELKTPDNVGTAQEETVLAEHQATFTELQDMKTEIGLYEARANLGGDVDELSRLKDDFAKQAVDAYLDLYVEGASQDGAAISEQQFVELRNTFTNTIASPEKLGFNNTIEAGMLDEFLAQSTLSTSTDEDKYKTVRALDQQMADSYIENKNQGAYDLTAILGTFLSAGILFLICGPMSFSLASRWREQPDYIEKRPSSRKPGKYGQH